MQILSYSNLPGATGLSSAGRGRMMLIEAEMRDGILAFRPDIQMGDELGHISADNSHYRVERILPIATLDTLDLSKMNRPRCFLVVIQTRDNVLKLIELTLIH